MKGLQTRTGTVHYAKPAGDPLHNIIQTCGHVRGQYLYLEPVSDETPVTCKRCIAAGDTAATAEAARHARITREQRPATSKRANAGDKRSDALRDLTSRYRDEAAILAVGRETVAVEIEALLHLGRTDRWQDAITAWAKEVRDNDSLSWAWFQYGIWAGYAA